jgi:predicted ribosomally synthesized peptide with SipW-like signal peptide
VRRIIVSLFVIAGLVGVGVFATSAYFTDTVNESNLTFTTGNADLKFGFCDPGVGGNCADEPVATLDSFDFGPLPDVLTGPGQTHADCLYFDNTGDYALNLTGGIFSYFQSHPDMDDAFLVKAELANSSCQATSPVFGSQSVLSAYNAGFQSFGSLAPAGRLYVIWSNSWDSTGNQNALQNQWIQINSQMTGKTE